MPTLPDGLDPALLAVVAAHSRGVLATIKRDGRPQLSNIDYTVDIATGVVRASLTDARAKTRNLRRDPRASLYVTTEGLGSYVVVEGIATITPPAADTHDSTVEELVDVYRAIRGEHPDWEEYRQAMVDDGRVVLTLPLDRGYGYGAG